MANKSKRKIRDEKFAKNKKQREKKKAREKKALKKQKKSKKKNIKKKLSSKEVTQIEKEASEHKKLIKKLFLKEVKANTNSTSASIELGHELNLHKEMVLKIGLSWSKYRSKNFPYIHEKKAQRYMRVARKVNLEKAPILSVLSMRLLTEIIQRLELNKIKQKTIKQLFKHFEIDIETAEVPNDVESIAEFKQNAEKCSEFLIGGTGWMDDPDDRRQPSIPQEQKDIQKQINKSKRDNKKRIRRDGRIESSELELSISRGTSRLISNLSFLTGDSENILFENDKKQIVVNFENISALRKKLRVVVSKHKKSRLKIKLVPDDE